MDIAVVVGNPKRRSRTFDIKPPDFAGCLPGLFRARASPRSIRAVVFACPQMTLGMPDRRRGTTRQKTASHGQAALRRLSAIAFFRCWQSPNLPTKIQS